MLGSSVSTFFRMRRRYETEGMEGLLDKKSARPPLNEVKVVALFKTDYRDFTAFSEKLPGDLS